MNNQENYIEILNFNQQLFKNNQKETYFKSDNKQIIYIDNFFCNEKCNSDFLKKIFIMYDELNHNWNDDNCEYDNNSKTKTYLKHLITNKYQSNLSFDNQKIEISSDYLKKYNLQSLCNSKIFKLFLQEKFYFQPDYFSKLVSGKKICLVGPADYNNPNSHLIDQYDLVVRINKGTQMESTGNHGSRTDILYHVVNQHKENGGPIKIEKPYHLRLAYPILNLEDNSTFNNIGTIRDFAVIFYHSELYNSFTETNFSIVDEIKYIQFEQILKSRPNSGLIAIWDLLQYDIQELYITGFTLFQTNYNINYRSTVDNQLNTGEQATYRMKQHGNHDQYKSSLYFRENILNHPKVIYDLILKDCVDNIINQ